MSRILIIDDSHEFTELVARALRHRGHDAQSAHSGRAGLGLAGAQRPDLVILDLHLAEESGIEVLHRLRDLFPDLPVVIVTGQPDVPSAVAALKGSAVDYLCKPFKKSRSRCAESKSQANGRAPFTRPRTDGRNR